MYTTAQKRYAAIELQSALEAIRKDEVLPFAIAILLVGALSQGLAALYLFYDVLPRGNINEPGWRGFIEFVVYLVVSVVILIEGPQQCMKLCRRLPGKMARLYDDLARLLGKESHKSIALDLIESKFAYPRDHNEDAVNLDYIRILGRV